MEQAQFDAMVARLERDSTASPGLYQAKVAALALVGFVILAAVIGFAGIGLLLIGGLALATLLTGGKAIILLLKLGKLLVLLAIPLWMLVKSSLSALFTRLPPPQGLEIRRAQAPGLFDALDDMRRRMKGPRFHHVLLTDEVNAAAMQRPLFGLFGFPRNYLILGLPLLEAFRPDEALAVVAHEYGHLAGSHSRFGAFIYRLRLTWGTIQQVTSQWTGWASKPFAKLVGWYAPYFNAYTFVLARANEYQADAASAELVGAEAAASALKRVNIVGPQFDGFNEKTFDAVRDLPAPPDDRAVRWAGVALRGVEPGQDRSWLADALQREPQALDTHPALRQRLGALPGQAARLDEPPQPVDGPSAATAWLGSALPALRESMQREWHARLAEPWKQRHEELRVKAQRLVELDAMTSPSVDEQVERLRLRVELHPDENPVDALAAFNAEHPGVPVTVFIEGRERLARDDESGLALLERTIELDADATRPACECAHEWLTKRRDERAKAWAERWMARVEYETRLEHERSTLDPKHPVHPHDLDAPALAAVIDNLRTHGTGIARAWLVRRVLPTDPNVPTYVLGFEMTTWAGLRSQGPKIVDQLAAQTWPMHVFLVALDSEHKKLKKAMKLLPSAVLPLKSFSPTAPRAAPPSPPRCR